jgi:hypothetical protein
MRKKEPKKLWTKVKGRRIKVPLFELAANPEIRIQDVKGRRWFILDDGSVEAEEEVIVEEENQGEG